MIKIGTRSSLLAVKQAKIAISAMKKSYIGKKLRFEIVKITTSGDNRVSGTPSVTENIKGLFTKEIHEALISEKIDIAVHSAKDLQAHTPDAFEIAAILKRCVPHDALLSDKYPDIFTLPIGAKIGTSSIRRLHFIKNFRPDINIIPIRGNINTRVYKMRQMQLDGIIISYCGVKRLKCKMTKYISKIPYNISIPAIGQGAIALEVRKGDAENKKYAMSVNHTKSFNEVELERKIARKINATCGTPIGCNAKISGKSAKIRISFVKPSGDFIKIEKVINTENSNQEIDKIGDLLLK